MPNQPRNKFGRQARMQRRNATSTSKQSPGVERKVDASADRVDIVLPAVNVTAKGPRYADVRAGRTTAAQESKFRYRKAQEAKAAKTAKAAQKPSSIKPVATPSPPKPIANQPVNSNSNDAKYTAKQREKLAKLDRLSPGLAKRERARLDSLLKRAAK